MTMAPIRLILCLKSELFGMTRRQSTTMVTLTLTSLPTSLERRTCSVIFVIIIRSTAHKDSLASRNRAIISTFTPCEIAGRFLPSLNVNHACGIMPMYVCHIWKKRKLYFNVKFYSNNVQSIFIKFFL